MQRQITTDRQAIAKAEAARTKGIVETIFGVVLAPLTGGVSLILAGIGVASITEAEEAVDGLEAAIRGYQTTIASDQADLADDAREIATLNGLTMCTQIALDDMSLIAGALDALRTTWSSLRDELASTAGKVQDAEDAQGAAVGQAWYHAAAADWDVIIPEAQGLQNLPTSTNRVTIP